MRLLPLRFRKDGPTGADVHVDGSVGAVATFRPGPGTRFCPKGCTKRHSHQYEEVDSTTATSKAATMTQAQVHYRVGSEAGPHCGNCSMFRLQAPDFETGDCTLVKGRIYAGGVCDKWKAGQVGQEVGDTGLNRTAGGQVLEKTLMVKAAGVKFAGLVVKAVDTGRILLLQRAAGTYDGQEEEDPEAGKWEFPGGHLEPGEDPLEGAMREWGEEVGVKVPPGMLGGAWKRGQYAGFLRLVPSETIDPEHWVPVDNPDHQVHGVQHEVCQWVDPDEARDWDDLRSELIGDDDVWDQIEAAGDVWEEPGDE